MSLRTGLAGRALNFQAGWAGIFSLVQFGAVRCSLKLYTPLLSEQSLWFSSCFTLDTTSDLLGLWQGDPIFTSPLPHVLLLDSWENPWQSICLHSSRAGHLCLYHIASGPLPTFILGLVHFRLSLFTVLSALSGSLSSSCCIF